MPTSNCPEAPHYTAQELHKIEQSVVELPEQSPLILVPQDYIDLLDKLKVETKLNEVVDLYIYTYIYNENC